MSLNYKTMGFLVRTWCWYENI